MPLHGACRPLHGACCIRIQLDRYARPLQALAKTVGTYWASFAAAGRPSDPAGPVQHWPSFDAATAGGTNGTYLLLDGKGGEPASVAIVNDEVRPSLLRRCMERQCAVPTDSVRVGGIAFAAGAPAVGLRLLGPLSNGHCDDKCVAPSGGWQADC